MDVSDHFDYRSNKKLHSLFLKQSIRLCYEKRWVTEWLFDDLASSVIRTDFVIPPDCFSRGCFSTVSAGGFLQNTTQSCKTTVGNMVLIPVSHSDDVTIGYTFMFAFPNEIKNYGIGLNDNLPFDFPFIARFAYDHRGGGNLIFTMVGGNPKQIGISSDFYSMASGSEGSFIVPAKEYTWDNLPQHPSTVFVGTTNLFGSLCSEARRMDMLNLKRFCGESGDSHAQDEYQSINYKSGFNISRSIFESLLFPVEEIHNCSYQHDGFMSGSTLRHNLSSGDINPHRDVLNLCDLKRNEGTDSNWTSNADVIDRSKKPHQTLEAGQKHKINHTPLVISGDGHVADRANFSEVNDNEGTSLGVFNMDLMNESIREIEKVTSNWVYPYPQRFDHDPDPGYQSGVHLYLNSSDEFIRNCLQQNCMQAYYDVVLQIDVDYNFFSNPPVNGFKKIAPRPNDIPLASQKNITTLEEEKTVVYVNR